MRDVRNLSGERGRSSSSSGAKDLAGLDLTGESDGRGAVAGSRLKVEKREGGSMDMLRSLDDGGGGPNIDDRLLVTSFSSLDR